MRGALFTAVFTILASSRLFSNSTAEQVVVAAGFEDSFSKKRKLRECNEIRDRGYSLRKFHRLDDRLFKRMFRMSKPSFYKLLNLIRPHLKKKSILHAINSSGSIISDHVCLAITLRWMAGASYIDLLFGWDIAAGSFYAEDGPLWSTMNAIDKALDLSFPLHDEAKLRKIADGFSWYSNHRLQDCVMAVDGWVMRTRAPRLSETNKVTLYWNRHKCYGMVVMAGCDSNLRYHMFSVVSSGELQSAVIIIVSYVNKLFLKICDVVDVYVLII